jgi:hypothetical protein
MVWAVPNSAQGAALSEMMEGAQRGIATARGALRGRKGAGQKAVPEPGVQRP